MADDVNIRLSLPTTVRRLPADLAVVFSGVLLAWIVALLPVLRETPLRAVFGIPLVLFLPGYAVVSLLFPEAGENPRAAEQSGYLTRSVDPIERVALSFGVSVAVVPLFGLLLSFSPWGLELAPLSVALGGFTAVSAAAAWTRRKALPEAERFSVPYRRWLRVARSELDPSSRSELILTVVFGVAVLLAASSVVYVVATPGLAYTEFSLLTEDASGDLVTSGYPTDLTVGESESLVLSIGNHEGRAVEYTVVVELQHLASEDGTVSVVEEQELDRFSVQVDQDDTRRIRHSVTPQTTGDRLRLVYFLYLDAPPSDPSTANAYRETDLAVSVSAPA